MENITEKAEEIATSVLKDFHDKEALAVLEIAKVLIEQDSI